MYVWSPSITHALLWVEETSCCEEYTLCCEEAEYFVRRRTADGGFEETARGRYGPAAIAWIDLARRHTCPHQRAAS
ncbi:hypothetical protein HII36_47290 [Nonomuraea sp. NN258]|uniref:hypothetical protein n=1 Tax=Nonomuraea antri TaxID=2730852 RepID=UPI00156894E1|nr:hypothetical protein [Nonomuraea antri]NRQ39380.1 hypothetical protein [Nonomuraea antri]